MMDRQGNTEREGRGRRAPRPGPGRRQGGGDRGHRPASVPTRPLFCCWASTTWAPLFCGLEEGPGQLWLGPFCMAEGAMASPPRGPPLPGRAGWGLGSSPRDG